MKLRKLYQLTLCCLLAVSYACQDDDNIFEKSADERREELFDKASDLLTNAPSGWAIDYFATPTSGGYNLLATFDDQGTVSMAAYNKITNNTYIEQASRYKLGISSGPALIFETYNNVLHPFCDPDPNGNSLGGDFEFVIVDVSQDTIEFRGLRTFSKILLHRIPSGNTKEQYMSKIKEMENMLFSAKSPDLQLVLEDPTATTTYSITQNGNFILSLKRGDRETLWPFIITEKGIRLYDSERITGTSSYVFELNDEKTALVSTQDPLVRITGPENLSTYISQDKRLVWLLDRESMSDNMKVQYDKIVASCKVAPYNGTDVKLGLHYSVNEASYAFFIEFKSGRRTYEGNLNFKYQAENNKSLSILSPSNVEGDANALIFHSTIEGYKEMYELITNNYSLSTPTPINPSSIRLENTQNNGHWFTVTRN